MHLDFALPIDGDLEAGIKRHDQKAELAVMDYSYHVPITKWTEKVIRHDPLIFNIALSENSVLCGFYLHRTLGTC